jgi:hypothetical protein
VCPEGTYTVDGDSIDGIEKGKKQGDEFGRQKREKARRRPR